VIHARRSLRGIALLLPFVAGCASSAPAELAPSDRPTVQLVIHNERTSTVTAYVQWEGLDASRLGVIGAGSSETYLPSYRGTALCVRFASFGNTSFSTAVPDREPPYPCESGVEVDRGQRLDVFLRADGGLCYLQHDLGC